jgi:uncharacterized protein
MTDDNKKTGQQSYQDDAFEDSDDASMLVDLGDSEDQSGRQSSGRGNQGFASMPKERQREIASKGGKAAHEQGTAHEWTSEEAAEAGRRGGQSRSSSANNEE